MRAPWLRATKEPKPVTRQVRDHEAGGVGTADLPHWGRALKPLSKVCHDTYYILSRKHHIADVHTNPHHQLLTPTPASIPPGQPLLHFNGAVDGVRGGRETPQKRVAHLLHHVPVIPADALFQDSIMRPEQPDGGILIPLRAFAETLDIGEHHGDQSTSKGRLSPMSWHERSRGEMCQRA